MSRKVKEMGSTADPDAVTGNFNGTKFQLVKRINYRNSFNPTFYGKLELENSGTKISGDFGVLPLVKFFIYFWLTGVSTFALSFTFLAKGEITFPVIIPYLMLIFGILLVKFGVHAGKSEGKGVLIFLTTTLEASPVTPKTASTHSSDKPFS
jgi:hypothetical protein